MPSILFVHQNFPAQFRGLKSYLAEHGWDVLFATARKEISPNVVHKLDDGTSVIRYQAHRERSENIHRYVAGLETAVLNSQGFARVAIALRNQNYQPDIIVAHSGWGGASFAKVIWPDAKLVQYLEWWYTYPPRDRSKDYQVEMVEDRMANALCRNMPFLLDLQSADGVLVPTEFQAAEVPEFVRPKIKILHDGVDCSFFSPGDRVPIKVEGGVIKPDVPLVTYATRGMEPKRGFPEFMEALYQLQQTHPDVHCIVAGADSVHYDRKLEGDSYKQRMLDGFDYDMSRLHFVGHLPLEAYRDLLRRSDAHVSLTQPFVVSWSLCESMAVGAPLIVSANDAVREMLPDDRFATAVDHEDIDALHAAIAWTLDNPEAARAKGDAARVRAVKTLNTDHIYPAHVDYFEDILDGA